ncbi:hypothetical protein FB451DRAFT_1557034, partial [Mycena latifolia]
MAPKQTLLTLDGAPLAMALETTLQQSAQAASKLRTELVRLEEEGRKAQNLRLTVEKQREALSGKLRTKEAEFASEQQAQKVVEDARRVAEDAQKVAEDAWKAAEDTLRQGRQNLEAREEALRKEDLHVRIDRDTLAAELARTTVTLASARHPPTTRRKMTRLRSVRGSLNVAAPTAKLGFPSGKLPSQLQPIQTRLQSRRT